MRAKKHFEDLNTSEIDKKNSSEIEYSEEKNDIYTALKLLSEEEKSSNSAMLYGRNDT